MATVDTPHGRQRDDQCCSCGQCGRRNGRESGADWSRQEHDPNVASEASVAEAGSVAGKNSWENQDRRGRVDVEIKEPMRRSGWRNSTAAVC